MIRLLKPSEVIERWRFLAPLFEESVESSRGHLSMADLVRGCLSEEYHMWLSEHPVGVLFCRFVRYPEKRVYRLMLLVANLELAKQYISTVESFAAVKGCDEVEIFGREGWLKTLSGYDRTHVVMSKDIRVAKKEVA